MKAGLRMKKKRYAFAAAITAGAIWGVSFLAPHALGGSDASTLSLFRFLFFGALSGCALLLRWRNLPNIRFSDIFWGSGLALLGYSFYYFLLSFGVQNAGVAFTTLIIGLLPLTILLGSVPRIHARQLAPPFLLVLAGVILIPIELFRDGVTLGVSHPPLERGLGLIAAASALASWTFFSILNSRFLKRRKDWSALDWSSWLGIFAAGTAFLVFWVGHPGTVLQTVANSLSLRFLLWTGFMGIMGAWVATWLWNNASRVLPAAVVGQLLVSEMVFGLCFGFIYDQRLPSVLEGLAMMLLFFGAFFGIRAVNRIMSMVDGAED